MLPPNAKVFEKRDRSETRRKSKTTCVPFLSFSFYITSNSSPFSLSNSKGYPFFDRTDLHCCNKADSLTCMETCKKILYTATTDREILNALTEKCGPPISPQSPFWSCLMKSGSPKPVRLPLDAGKLSCCTKAIKPKCQDLCWRAFKADWESSWHPLDAECLSSSQEGELRRCLAYTDDPCEMGCAGLSYCTRFNDRSTTLFR